MQKDDTLITVLMPAYNAAAFISEAITSVLIQTYRHFELLIINDGSTDNTGEIIDSFKDARIVLINQEKLGVVAALNRGLQYASSGYIARFDADDICFPGRLEKQLAFLINNPEYVAVGCDAEYITAGGEHLFNFTCIGHTHKDIQRKLFFYCPFIHSGVMYKKEAVLKAGGYFNDAHNFEDYLLWVRLSKLGKFYNLPEQLIKVRFHPSSVTIDEKWRGRRFRKLKRTVIHRGTVTKEEGDELLRIIEQQEVHSIKEGAYYALCGKKYLLDNHQPRKARADLSKAIQYHPLKWDNYALYMLSYLPRAFINWLHKKSPNKI